MRDLQQEYSVIRDVVLKVLKTQGIANPSEEIIDNAIREHLEQKVYKINIELHTYITGG